MNNNCYITKQIQQEFYQKYSNMPLSSLIRWYVPLFRTSIRAFIPNAYFNTKSHNLFLIYWKTCFSYIDAALELLTGLIWFIILKILILTFFVILVYHLKAFLDYSKKWIAYTWRIIIIIFCIVILTIGYTVCHICAYILIYSMEYFQCSEILHLFKKLEPDQ